jgi:hypothetical protein
VFWRENRISVRVDEEDPEGSEDTPDENIGYGSPPQEEREEEDDKEGREKDNEKMKGDEEAIPHDNSENIED